MKRIFLPLVKEDEFYILTEDFLNQLIIVVKEDDYLYTSLENNFQKQSHNIKLNNLSYNDIEIFVPKTKIKDYCFVEVDEELRPIQLKLM